jgi:hypothetical protein
VQPEDKDFIPMEVREFMKRLGEKGGKARAEKLTKARRRAIAKKAAAASAKVRSAKAKAAKAARKGAKP